MGNHQPVAKVLWTNSSAGTGTTITATGDSGATLIELKDVTDLVLSVTLGVNPSGSSPTLLVQVDMQDACGNWITQVLKTSSLNTAGTVVVYGGLHNASPIVLTGFGRVAWTIGGTANPTFTQVGISLMGR